MSGVLASVAAQFLHHTFISLMKIFQASKYLHSCEFPLRTSKDKLLSFSKKCLCLRKRSAQILATQAELIGFNLVVIYIGTDQPYFGEKKSRTLSPEDALGDAHRLRCYPGQFLRERIILLSFYLVILVLHMGSSSYHTPFDCQKC